MFIIINISIVLIIVLVMMYVDMDMFQVNMAASVVGAMIVYYLIELERGNNILV